MKRVYPALLYELEEGGYVIKVPDIPGCVTTSETLDAAYSDIKDALSLCLVGREDMGWDIPAPSKLSAINDPDAMLLLVEVDTVEYRKQTDTKAVRKNVTIPAWMDHYVDVLHLNCSQLLQDAIRTRVES